MFVITGSLFYLGALALVGSFILIVQWQFNERSRLWRQIQRLIEEKGAVEQKVILNAEEIKKEQARLYATINSLNTGFILTDQDLSILLINDTGQKLFCRSEAGKPRDCTMRAISNTLKSQIDLTAELEQCLIQKREIELKNIRSGQRLLHIHLAPVLFKNDVIGIAMTAREIGARRAKSEIRSAGWRTKSE